MNVDPEELLGSLDSLIQFIDDNAATLTTKGLTTATVKTGLVGIRGDLFAKKTSRDNKRTALNTAQGLFDTSGKNNYTAFSDAIDVVSGAMGKKTADGKQVLKLRKNVTGSNKHSSTSTSGSSSSSSSSSSGSGSSSSSSSS